MFGVDRVNSTGTSAIQGFIRSGDFDIADGEFFASVSRFIPDYKEIVGNNQVLYSYRTIHLILKLAHL